MNPADVARYLRSNAMLSPIPPEKVLGASSVDFLEEVWRGCIEVWASPRRGRSSPTDSCGECFSLEQMDEEADALSLYRTILEWVRSDITRRTGHSPLEDVG